jgi:hypothetical protein
MRALDSDQSKSPRSYLVYLSFVWMARLVITMTVQWLTDDEVHNGT